MPFVLVKEGKNAFKCLVRNIYLGMFAFYLMCFEQTAIEVGHITN